MGELLYLKASCRAILILPLIVKTVTLLFHPRPISVEVGCSFIA
jgi:hypothetical protein